jgi:hypothetical protein
MTELASVHRLTRASLKKQRAGASFKAIKIKIKIKIKSRLRLQRGLLVSLVDPAGC